MEQCEEFNDALTILTHIHKKHANVLACEAWTNEIYQAANAVFLYAIEIDRRLQAFESEYTGDPE